MFWGALAVMASVVVAPHTGVEVARGGVVLPNIDDDGRRCAALTCNDSTDEVVNGIRDAEDLTTIRIPYSARISVTGPARAFVKHGNDWQLVRPGDRVRGTVGIEATEVKPSRIEVNVGNQVVPLRIAPLRTHTHLQKAQEVLVTDDLATPTEGEGIVGELLKLRRAAKPGFLKQLEESSPVPVRRVKTADIWTQDVMEPAYVTAGNQRMRVIIRTPLANEDFLRGPDIGPDIGTVRMAGPGTSVNAGGNIETIPPYPGRPEGRVVMGKRPDEPPNTELFDDPLLIDTSWLANAHVDEFVQFLPKPGGWRMAVADPMAGLEVLKGMPGDAKLVDGFQPGEPIFLDWTKLEFIRESPTVAQVLAKHTQANEIAARRIEENLAVLRRETGVTDVIRIPALFEHIPEVEPSIARAGMGGLVPTAVNGIVLDRHRYLAPDPHNSALRDAITKAYRKAGYEVGFVDHWRTHHLAGGGGLHCATNVLREM
ncbi:protein-arginine deiminase family protein [Kibdelosporangium aridum]|uniref:protein-arginine deiminase family protein n=1 Tax=Kibdelosporangium aridum TaxID=2030 RepID=UPI000524835A